MTDNHPQPKTAIDHQAEPKFNWKNCWYPVAFLQDLQRNRPYCFSLYDIPLVLFRNQSGEWGCLEDRCSHRAAKLSDGRLVDGKIECLYHGWQFSVQGDCLHIPQLPQGATIPQKACISTYQTAEHQGVVWVWPGESHLADRGKIITEAHLDEDGMVCIDTVADLPFEQTYLGSAEKGLGWGQAGGRRQEAGVPSFLAPPFVLLYVLCQGITQGF